jgi:hypothetical protein
MKSPRFFLFGILLLIHAVSFGQRNHKDNPSLVQVISSEDIFKQGVWNFNLTTPLEFNTGITKQDGDKTGNYTDFRTHIEANYFLIDGFAVGAGVEYSTNKDVYTYLNPEEIDKVEVVSGIFNAIYGFRAGNVINIKTKASFSGGVEKNSEDNGYGVTETKDHFYNINVDIGTPIQLQRNVFITPEIGYNFRHYKGEQYDYKENRNSFYAGACMDFYMGCGDDHCDLSGTRVPFTDRYRQGSWEAGSSMFGNIRIGSSKTTEDYGEGGVYTTKEGLNRINLMGKLFYYPIDNLGVGGAVDIFNSRRNNKDSGYKYSSTDFLFIPSVKYHIPLDNALKNLYGEAGFGIGFSNDQQDDNGDVTKTKYFTTSWNVQVGYDYFINRNFSFNPFVGYEGLTYKEKESGNKYGYGGLISGVQLSYWVKRN